MLIQGTYFKSMPVGSIRSAGRIGNVIDLVINPHNLHIDGLICRIVGERNNQIIMPTDIRDISQKAVVIDDHDRLIEPGDAVRLKPILELRFSFTKLNAYVGKKKVGVIIDYAVDDKSLFIQKIYIQPSLLNRWSADRLVFDRNQVEEVTRTKIVFIDSSKEKVKNPITQTARLPLSQPSLSTSLTKEYE